MGEVVLNEMDRDEMWDVARLINPDLTEEEFERDWQEFLVLKAKKGAQ